MLRRVEHTPQTERGISYDLQHDITVTTDSANQMNAYEDDGGGHSITDQLLNGRALDTTAPLGALRYEEFFENEHMQHNQSSNLISNQ